MSESTLSRPPRSRLAVAGLVLVGLLVLFAVFLGGVQLFEWTESTAFCSSCHVMDPEVTAYRGSPHARVDCGTCHIGPGALPAVQAKLASARYLYELPLNRFERPIPSPITSLRPVEVVCEQCHWPQKFYEDRLVVLSRYAPDDKNSLTQTALQMKTGGGTAGAGQGRGIHWHIENPIYYIAADEKRQDIPWVQAEYGGVKTEYLSTDSKLTPEQIASAEKRKMDCVDCHNRATHVFARPSDAIDGAMAAGVIPADLPFIKQEGTAVLEQTYATAADGQKAVAGIVDTYKTSHPDVYAARQADVEKAVTALTGILNTTQFPDMRVNWQTHPNNIGHKEFPGCFRCHDGKHLSKDNQAIRLECNICHSIPQVAGPGQVLQPIPVVNLPEPDSHRSTTWLAEHRFKFDATCTACHDIGNPGGTDNSSFCSNSACHGGEWKFVGLNAPQVRSLSEPPKAPGGGQPKPIPHPIAPRVDCKTCHGPDKVRPFPADHAAFTIDMCTSCHQPTVQAEAAPPATPAGQPTAAPTAPAATAEAAPTGQAAAAATGGIPLIPHEIAGREQCLTCHNPEGGIRPAPQDHVGRSEATCQGCHKPAAATGAAPTPEATAASTPEATAAPTLEATAAPTGAAAAGSGIPPIPHPVAGQEQCLTCHGPGGLRPVPADHAGRTVETCQGCHKPA